MPASRSSTRPRRPPRRAQVRRGSRPDGAATRGAILQAAGHLFAERGYADTTSKAICAAARSNIAAVNYHFGSRDRLYVEVLREVHRHLVTADFLRHLADSALPARTKLDRFIDGVCGNLADVEQWQTRLWARELLSPSPHLRQIMRSEALPKFKALSRILAEVAGLPPQHPAVPRCVLSVMAPFLMLLVMHRDLPGPARIIHRSRPEQIAAQMKIYVRAGLEAVGATLGGVRKG